MEGIIGPRAYVFIAQVVFSHAVIMGQGRNPMRT